MFQQNFLNQLIKLANQMRVWVSITIMGWSMYNFTLYKVCTYANYNNNNLHSPPYFCLWRFSVRAIPLYLRCSFGPRKPPSRFVPTRLDFCLLQLTYLTSPQTSGTTMRTSCLSCSTGSGISKMVHIETLWTHIILIMKTVTLNMIVTIFKDAYDCEFYCIICIAFASSKYLFFDFKYHRWEW